MGEFDFEKLDREVDDLLADVKGLLDVVSFQVRGGVIRESFAGA